MLDLENGVVNTTLKIDVPPSNNIFRELGNNIYNFEELISEFVDNSLAARKDTVICEIEVGISELQREMSYVLIKDNAAGIPRTQLGRAISPAAAAGGGSLNEHGLGMKQAIAALGDLKYLATRTEEDDQAIVVDEFKFGEIIPKTLVTDWKRGTEICIIHLKAIVPTALQSYTKSVVPYLGARYRRYLKDNEPLLAMTLRLVDLDDLDSNTKVPSVLNEWKIQSIKPVYFHPNKRKNEPVLRQTFKGAGWESELTFGYAPTDDEYAEMGLKPPKNYEPYSVAIAKQGLDIIRNDRIIKFHQLSEIQLVATPHNQYNYVRGEIDLKKGFVTAITKNNVIVDRAFEDLIIQIRETLEEHNLLVRRTFPDELPEKLLRDRLSNHLKTRKINPKTDVKTEYAIEGLGGFVDVLADKEA